MKRDGGSESEAETNEDRKKMLFLDFCVCNQQCSECDTAEVFRLKR